MPLLKNVTGPDLLLEEDETGFKYARSQYLVRFYHGTSFDWPSQGIRPAQIFRSQIPNRGPFDLLHDTGDGFQQWLEWDHVGFNHLHDMCRGYDFQRNQIPSEFIGRVWWGQFFNFTEQQTPVLIPDLCRNLEKLIVRTSPDMTEIRQIGRRLQTNVGPIFYPMAEILFFASTFFKRCKGCGVQFLTENKNKKFHSERCRMQYHNNRPKPDRERKCHICGKDISSKNSGAKTCCPAHRTALCRMQKQKVGV